jgi:hypothetical protein
MTNQTEKMDEEKESLEKVLEILITKLPENKHEFKFKELKD